MKDILLITPPFTQLNTPYPATAYLKGFLNTKGISSFQVDLGIEVILELFSANQLSRLFVLAKDLDNISSDNAARIYGLREEYINTIDSVIAFLQGKDPTLARQICTDEFLPQSARFEILEELDWAFGSMGMQDRAKHLATLYLEDLSDFIVECVDEHFGFSRYAERLGRSANSFDPLYQQLKTQCSFVDEITLHILECRIKETSPELIAFSVPFPGNLYSAFRCAKYVKEHYPELKTVMGGGFANTELRSLSDVRVFEFFDFITLDDGELPIELVINHLQTGSDAFKRTFVKENETVIYKNGSSRHDYKQVDVGTPDYTDLLLDRYISAIEVVNPMHSLWSDGRWNKLTMAHGCYWGKCTFCDISLDYIKLYEPIAAKTLVDRMEELIAQTGERGFHFVDEAAPPALMREVALEILRRKLTVTWWTNIRFEKSFTRDLCRLLQRSGCVAVSGGLEVASDRLLALIDKGVTVEQVARVTRNFAEAGIMVHAYLMYGYPTQTIQETVDSLEMVRQMFELNVLQSGFWHQFALTAHSPVGLNPENYGVLPDLKEASFAHNDIAFRDRTGINHSKFSQGLKKSLFNYMHGLGFELPLRAWFDFKIPQTNIKPDYIEICLESDVEFLNVKPGARLVWTEPLPETTAYTDDKNGRILNLLRMDFHNKKETYSISLQREKGEWLVEHLGQMALLQQKTTFHSVKESFEKNFDDFDPFWYSKPIDSLRRHGLLLI